MFMVMKSNTSKFIHYGYPYTLSLGISKIHKSISPLLSVIGAKEKVKFPEGRELKFPSIHRSYWTLKEEEEKENG